MGQYMPCLLYTSTEVVHIGSKVRIREVGTQEDEVYKIVGSTETDPQNGRISDESPIGKAMLGHEAGDVVEVLIPADVYKRQLNESGNKNGIE